MKYVLLLSLLYVSTSFSSQPPSSEDNASIAVLQQRLARRHSATVAIPRLQGDSPKSFARRVGSAIARLDSPTSISKNLPETNNKG